MGIFNIYVLIIILALLANCSGNQNTTQKYSQESTSRSIQSLVEVIKTSQKVEERILAQEKLETLITSDELADLLRKEIIDGDLELKDRIRQILVLFEDKKRGSIAFERNGQIYLSNHRGDNIRQLTKSAEQKLKPSFIHNGTKMFFNVLKSDEKALKEGVKGGSLYIVSYIIDIDGSNETLLPSSDFSVHPWDDKIAYAQGKEHGIFLYDLKTGKQKQLTSGHSDHNPVFSPDGKSIAFVSLRAEDDSQKTFRDQVCLVDTDKSNVTQLTTKGGSGPMKISHCGKYLIYIKSGEYSSALIEFNTKIEIDLPVGREHQFTPDGKKVLYQHLDAPGRGCQILLYDIEGKKQYEFASDRDNIYPVFNSNGSKLAYISNRSFKIDLYITDGMNEQLLAQSEGHLQKSSAVRPYFSPDGKSIVFVSYKALSESQFCPEVRIIDTNGKNEINLGNGTNPVWGPALMSK